MVHNGAANRDPRHFEAPAELRLDRTDGRLHLGFGFGIHTCVGAPLARAEARVSLERFLAAPGRHQDLGARARPGRRRRYEYSPIYMLRGPLESASNSGVRRRSAVAVTRGTGSIPTSRR